MKVVAIGAHPDDYEIGAAMRLMYHIENGDEVVGIICSCGEMAGEKKTRVMEAEKAAKHMGLKNIHQLEFPDTRLPLVSDSIREKLEDLIQIENPLIVYTHHKDDRHQDHEIIARMSDIACRRVPSIYTYKSPSTRGEFDPHQFYVGSEKEFERKIELIKIYQSQLGRDGGLDLDMVMHEARATTSRMSCYIRKKVFVEPFCANHVLLNVEDYLKFIG